MKFLLQKDIISNPVLKDWAERNLLNTPASSRFSTHALPRLHVSLNVCNNLVLCAFQGVFVAIFLMVSRPTGKYREVGAETEPIINKHLENGVSGGGSANHSTFNLSAARLFGSTSSLNLDRPPGMSGIIPCSSYKNRLGTWNRKDAEYIFSQSYGSTHDNSTAHASQHGW